MMSSNLTWKSWWPDLYSDAPKPTGYPGGDESYKLAGEFLKGDDQVEEWGCATTYGRQFIPAPYRGVDGAPSQWVDQVADLSTYRSETPRALIRHVLEHNWNWRDIMKNFMESFTDRGVIILFIPLGRHDINRSFEHREGEVPTPPGLQLDDASFNSILYQYEVVVKDEVLENETPPFDYERIYYIEKKVERPRKTVTGPYCTIGDCMNKGTGQVRTDYTILGNRFEYAFNACEPHQAKSLNRLYFLDVPEVEWD